MNKQACNAMPIMNCLLTHENNKYTAHECISKYTNTILMNNKNCIYAVVRLIYLIIRYMIHALNNDYGENMDIYLLSSHTSNLEIKEEYIKE